MDEGQSETVDDQHVVLAQEAFDARVHDTLARQHADADGDEPLGASEDLSDDGVAPDDVGGQFHGGAGGERVSGE